jgi:hypothetical protein
MARRRDPDLKEFNPLDDVRFPIDRSLVRDVITTTDTVVLPAVPAPPPAPEPSPAKSLGLEKLNKYNKFLTTPREKLELERLAARISGALGVSVRSSQLIRACLIYLLHAEPTIIRRAEQHPPIKRPSNSEPIALAEFDHVLAEILSQAFREAGPIKASAPMSE